MVKFSTVSYTTLIGMLFGVPLVWGVDEQGTNQDSFETCLDELKAAANNPIDEDSGNDFEPEMSLEESIRIYDECMKREGVTLSLHGTLAEGEGTASGGAGVGSDTSKAILDSITQEEGAESINNNSQSSSGEQSHNLESSLQEFDQMLSQVQGEIESEQAEHLAQESAGKNQDSQSRELSTSEPQLSSEPLMREESEETHNNPSAMVSAEAKHQDEESRTPLDPKDEDIVLKTIREAAELETNPKVRQALWDQYYDYADNQK